MTAVAAVEISAGKSRKQRSITSIDEVESRKALGIRRQPHWKSVKNGAHIGYRKMIPGADTGVWLCRCWIGNDYAQKSLGDFGDLPSSERYDAAVKAAEPHFAHHAAGGSTEKVTVKQAAEAYVERKRLEEGEASAKYAAAAIRRTIDEDQISGVLLAKLTEGQCMAWRARLLVKAGGVENTSSFNRSLVEPRAALNLAFEDRKITSRPWLRALKRLVNDHSDGEPRDLYLNREERQRLVNACSDEVRPFVSALAQMPMRCGELAKLKVSMLDERGRCLKIPVSKTKARVAPLGALMLVLFQQQAAGKQPGDWLFARADGSQWDANSWGPEIRAARAKAGLPEETCLYSLRHAGLTDLVVGGCDLMTAAQVAGTSLQQIEKHYGKLLPEHARAHLDKLAFAPSNVVQLKAAA